MRVCELFAGVGGFRVGLERYSDDFKTVFFNQWEPAYKTQFAYECYISHFPLTDIEENVRKYTNMDIHEVPKEELPDFDLLVGGFPCQNYSVAGPKSSKGIEGKKGVLWWDIRSTLEAKRPSLVLLENVDRLLKSPASQRGRDFGIILKCFDELGYHVEWYVINAAEYNKPQKRRRTFIFAYDKEKYNLEDDYSFFSTIFPMESDENEVSISISEQNLTEINDTFKFGFENFGSMKDGVITTKRVKAIPIENTRTLRSILGDADDSFTIKDESKWRFLKGAKEVERTSKTGYTYKFKEGACPYPDNLDVPARTMLTSEGSINRSSHAIKDPKSEKMRIITPLEAERIQTFPDNWTEHGIHIEADGSITETTLTNRQRYFLMGNALVTELITDMAKELMNLKRAD